MGPLTPLSARLWQGAPTIPASPIAGGALRPQNQPKRSISEPALQPQSHGDSNKEMELFRTPPVPEIDVLPNTPSVFARDSESSPSPVTPVLQQGTRRQRKLHRRGVLRDGTGKGESIEATGEIQSISQVEGRLGLSVWESVKMLRGSVSTMDSVMLLAFGTEGQEGNRGGRTQVLHDTRASSGVFPES